MDTEFEEEFRQFVAARSAALYRTAFLLTGQREQAEDLLQGVLARAAQRWRVARAGNPDAYVRKALYHQQVSRWRHRSWRREQPTAAVPDRAAAGDPIAQVDSRLQLAAGLARLTASQRAVLVLRFYEDLPERDVAAILDVSVGTVRSQTARALARLRLTCPELISTEEAWV